MDEVTNQEFHEGDDSVEAVEIDGTEVDGRPILAALQVGSELVQVVESGLSKATAANETVPNRSQVQTVESDDVERDEGDDEETQDVEDCELRAAVIPSELTEDSSPESSNQVQTAKRADTDFKFEKYFRFFTNRVEEDGGCPQDGCHWKQSMLSHYHCKLCGQSYGNKSPKLAGKHIQRCHKLVNSPSSTQSPLSARNESRKNKDNGANSASAAWDSMLRGVGKGDVCSCCYYNKKYHYHCSFCEQSFTVKSRAYGHVMKHLQESGDVTSFTPNGKETININKLF